jgi:hypothetical protein
LRPASSSSPSPRSGDRAALRSLSRVPLDGRRKQVSADRRLRVHLGLIAGAAALYVAPVELAEHWLWALTPLLARAVAAWYALFGTMLLTFALAQRRPFEGLIGYATLVVWCVLLLALPLLHAGDVSGGTAWYALMVALLALALYGLRVACLSGGGSEPRSRRARGTARSHGAGETRCAVSAVCVCFATTDAATRARSLVRRSAARRLPSRDCCFAREREPSPGSYRAPGVDDSCSSGSARVGPLASPGRRGSAGAQSLTTPSRAALDRTRRRVDGRQKRRAEPSGESTGEGAGAAADVKRAPARRDAGDAHERGGERRAVAVTRGGRREAVSRPRAGCRFSVGGGARPPISVVAARCGCRVVATPSRWGRFRAPRRRRPSRR